ncbi:hypothetical protein BGX38DRAFT_1178621 [Terfezia claveryi]|nr:hypothetical protein BGX38DRAFT_1178621 [Terfezia claveryi]
MDLLDVFQRVKNNSTCLSSFRNSSPCNSTFPMANMGLIENLGCLLNVLQVRFLAFWAYPLLRSLPFPSKPFLIFPKAIHA